MVRDFGSPAGGGVLAGSDLYERTYRLDEPLRLISLDERVHWEWSRLKRIYFLRVTGKTEGGVLQRKRSQRWTSCARKLVGRVCLLLVGLTGKGGQCRGPLWGRKTENSRRGTSGKALWVRPRRSFVSPTRGSLCPGGRSEGRDLG